ncbi:MAG: hypothetical protein M1828_005804 [Chrysothrix sp. TS-e1954]|nr:MAG: hypothetical protein M1828_005804 [Chrysothrix sp. TS-e1954]
MASSVLQGLQRKPLEIIPYDKPPTEARRKAPKALNSTYQRPEIIPSEDQIMNICEGVGPVGERHGEAGQFSHEDDLPPLEGFERDPSFTFMPSPSRCSTPQLDRFGPSPTSGLLEEPYQRSMADSSIALQAPARNQAPSDPILHSPTAVSADGDSARVNDMVGRASLSMSDVERDIASCSENDVVITGSKRRLESPKSPLDRACNLRQHAIRRSGRQPNPSLTKGIPSAASQCSSIHSEREYEPNISSDSASASASDSNDEEEVDEDEDEDEDILAPRKRLRLSSRSSNLQHNDRGGTAVGLARSKRAALTPRPVPGGSGALGSRRSTFNSAAGTSILQFQSFERRADGALVFVFHPEDQEYRPARTIRSAKPVSRKPFTREEDALLLRLKKRGNLTWEDIYTQFTKCHPGRSVGSLQVRYSTRLRKRK